MADDTSDVLMKLVLGGQSILAGGTSLLKKDDKLLFDFWAGKFFEIEEFGVALNLMDFESEAGKAQTARHTETRRPAQHTASNAPDTAAAAAPPKAKFASWRDLSKDSEDVAALAFPVETEPFSVTRLLDRASPLLFESCASTTTFDSATVVKRKVTGQALSLQTYLRIDFNEVLLVGINWSDGDLLKERLRFICRSIRVQYRQQSPDGTLGAAASADWEQKMALRSAEGS